MDTLVENGTLLLSCIIVARFDDHARLLTEERNKACKRGGKQDANTVILTTVASGLIKARFVYAHKVVASTPLVRSPLFIRWKLHKRVVVRA